MCAHGEVFCRLWAEESKDDRDVECVRPQAAAHPAHQAENPNCSLGARGSTPLLCIPSHTTNSFKNMSAAETATETNGNGTSYKRRRVQRSPSPEYKLDDDDPSYEPYIPVAQRKQAKLAKLASWGANAEKDKAKKQKEEEEEREDEEREEERRRERARKERTLLMEAQEVHERKAQEGAYRIDFKLIVMLTRRCRRKED